MVAGEEGPGTGVRIRAAGGLLWRQRSGGDGVEVALVHRPRYDDWSMPKGKLDGREHPLHAAVREVGEETGVRAVVGRRLPTQEYTLGPDRKVVDYWAMTAAEETAGVGFTPTHEVDAMRWLPAEEAADRLTYPRDRALLRAFAVAPQPTATMLLVRHARAGSRSSWSGDDLLRPLDDAGRAQAAGLRRALPWFGPRRVLSADLLRCVQTVQELAADVGVPVEPEPALTEEAYEKDPQRAMDRLLASVGGEERVVVVCSQGGVIPDVVGRLATEHGVRLAKPKLPARKASVWALSFLDSELVAGDYYHDLATAAF
ncbi:MAG: NUDIX hydrolase [Mycobacteriales bacterium]